MSRVLPANKIDVGAGRCEGLVISNLAAHVEDIDVGNGVCHDDRMRNTGIDAAYRHGTIGKADAVVQSQVRGVRHLYFDPAALDLPCHKPDIGFKSHTFPGNAVDNRKPCGAPGTVAAHLGAAAV